LPLLPENCALIENTGTKFDVIYDPDRKLAKGQSTLLWRPEEVSTDEMKALTSTLRQSYISEACRLPLEGRLNDRYPEFRLMTVEALLTHAWAGKFH